MILLQRGDIVLARTKGFIGFLIRLITFSKVNHAFVVIDPVKGIIVEARPRQGVCYGNICDYADIVVLKHLNQTLEQCEVICDFVEKQVGQPYGFLDDAVYAAKVFGLRFFSNSKLISRLAIKWGWMCSELCAGALALANYKLPNPVNLMAPIDLLMFDVTY